MRLELYPCRKLPTYFSDEAKIIIVWLLLGFSSMPFADYQDEIKALTARIQELSGTETGTSDSQRFKEIIDMTYDYTMLSYPEYATYLGDPRGQDD
jgi:hypothetical protein